MKRTLSIIAPVALALATCPCIVEKRHTADGSLADGLEGNSIKVEEFDKIDLSGAGTIYYTQAPADSIRVEADAKDLKLIKIEQQGSTIYIGWKDEFRQRIAKFNHNRIIIYASSLNLTEVKLGGAGDFKADDIIKVEDLRVNAAGASKIELNRIEANSLKVSTAGAGSIEIDSAAVKTFYAKMSGAADFDASLYESDQVDIDVSGAGDVTLELNKCGDVNLDVSGAASVDIQGDARSLSKSKSGMASIDIDKLTLANK
ncbi:MAG: DUF2807 domain-containing protein [Bacteroidales bacterium]|nr:DUF2807 domain-containing protein [Bacteroidales bacterium]